MTATVGIFVHALTVDALIGVFPDEHDRRQPLVIDAELEISPPASDALEATVDYRVVRACAEKILSIGHIILLEIFAERLAVMLLDTPGVLEVDLCVRKPQALAPASAGVRIHRKKPNP